MRNNKLIKDHKQQKSLILLFLMVVPFYGHCFIPEHSSINPNFQNKYHKPIIHKITLIKENGSSCYVNLQGSQDQFLLPHFMRATPYSQIDEDTCKPEDIAQIEKMSQFAIENPVKVVGWPLIAAVGAIVGCVVGFIDENEGGTLEEAIENTILFGGQMAVAGATIGVLTTPDIGYTVAQERAMMKAGIKAGAKFFGAMGLALSAGIETCAIIRNNKMLLYHVQPEKY